MHTLMTNAFTPEVRENVESQPISNTTAIVTNSTPPFTKQFLHSQTKKKLVEICHSNHIRVGKWKKEALIAHMMDMLDPNPGLRTQLTTLLNGIDTLQHSSPAPHRKHYRKVFNAIDLRDKYYYQFAYPFPTRNWQTTMAFALINVGLLNSWVLLSEVNQLQLLEFRVKLAKQLLH